MAGRTGIQADAGLNLYRTTIPTWISFFTTNPSADHATAHGGVEWGPPRKRVFPTSAAGTPFWTPPEDLDGFVRVIRNAGSITWSSIVLTVTPSILVGVAVFDLVAGGNLRTWYPLEAPILVADGESHTIGTLGLGIEGD